MFEESVSEFDKVIVCTVLIASVLTYAICLILKLDILLGHFGIDKNVARIILATTSLISSLLANSLIKKD